MPCGTEKVFPPLAHYFHKAEHIFCLASLYSVFDLFHPSSEDCTRLVELHHA